MGQEEPPSHYTKPINPIALEILEQAKAPIDYLFLPV
jgi:hypothetical protein